MGVCLTKGTSRLKNQFYAEPIGLGLEQTLLHKDWVCIKSDFLSLPC